jgi:hypothetical protein
MPSAAKHEGIAYFRNSPAAYICRITVMDFHREPPEPPAPR